jgi:AraC-like DNA-binding protein
MYDFGMLKNTITDGFGVTGNLSKMHLHISIMKPIFLKIETGSSYIIREQVMAHVRSRCYYHPQVELVYFERSDGMAIIGDKVQAIEEGDLFLLGSNLPHLFRNDEKFLNRKLPVRIVVLHFTPDLWGRDFLEQPDMKPVRELLLKAQRGLVLKGAGQSEMPALLRRMMEAKGPERFILLLQTLSQLARTRQLRPILPTGFTAETDDPNEDRLNDVYAFTLQNFRRKIQTREIASVAHLSEHSFCRYFKNKTGKTYTAFLHEVRIRQACKLLSESNLSISQVIEESGFVNYSNFFRYFKQVTGRTPAEFQKLSLEAEIRDR